MKVIILAGGLGTRISELTKTIPKPMVMIKKKPLILRIIYHYIKYGYKEFIIAAGYKQEIIKKFFSNKKLNFEVKIVDTGQKTMTGGRLKRLKKIIGKEPFLLTYGDGLSSINIKSLVSFHKKTKSLATLTAVRPPARFGSIKIQGKKVTYFREKSRLDEGWINGGFFVMEPEVLNFLNSDYSILEKDALPKISKLGKLSAFKHYGFWQCMDTVRDKEILEKKIKF